MKRLFINCKAGACMLYGDMCACRDYDGKAQEYYKKSFDLYVIANNQVGSSMALEKLQNSQDICNAIGNYYLGTMCENSDPVPAIAYFKKAADLLEGRTLTRCQKIKAKIFSLKQNIKNKFACLKNCITK